MRQRTGINIYGRLGKAIDWTFGCQAYFSCEADITAQSETNTTSGAIGNWELNAGLVPEQVRYSV